MRTGLCTVQCTREGETEHSRKNVGRKDVEMHGKERNSAKRERKRFFKKVQ